VKNILIRGSEILENVTKYLSSLRKFKQDARGACIVHLLLTNSLGFVGFFFIIYFQYKMFRSKNQCIQASDSSEEDIFKGF